jgi:ribonuclease P/MRP protein subunit POP5
MYLAALAVGLAALTLSLLTLASHRRLTARLSRLESKLKDFEEGLKPAISDLRLIKRALSSALASLEAERALELLRRRRRRRYIAFYLIYEGDTPPSPEEVERAILRAVERLAGQLAVANSRLQLVYYDPVRAVGIVRATNDTKYIVLAGMGLVRMIGGKRVMVIPVRTSGTIKRARKALGIPRR